MPLGVCPLLPLFCPCPLVPPGLYYPNSLLRAKVRPVTEIVKVRAHNPDGQAIMIEALDLTARILQHEIDHLHGVLIIDKPA